MKNQQELQKDLKESPTVQWFSNVKSFLCHHHKFYYPSLLPHLIFA